MSLPLLDLIYYCERKEPATIEDFIEFGLQPEDYVLYIGLFQRLQSELLISGQLQIGKELQELITFCKDKRLLAFDYEYSEHLLFFNRRGAEYRYGWFRYPKNLDDFRLSIEPRLVSLDYEGFDNEEEDYLIKKFGIIKFDYTNCREIANGLRVANYDSPVYIERYNSETKEYETIKKSETKKMFEIVKKDKYEIEKEIEEHNKMRPVEHDVKTVSEGLPWVKKYYKLMDCSQVLDSVYESMQDAVYTQNKIKPNDELYVFCGSNTCKEAGHDISEVKVNLSFNNSPDVLCEVQRCSDCKRYQISLMELTSIMLHNSGIPRCKIIFDDSVHEEFLELEEMCVDDSASEIYEFKKSDTLHVFCGSNICKKEQHDISDVKVNFNFNGRPNSVRTIQRCSDCLQFQITLKGLTQIMLQNRGIPNCKLVFSKGETSDFSSLEKTSEFFEMGYTVSESAGLSATQRQNILKNAMGTGKVSKNQVLRFLKQRMETNGVKPGNESALKKWSEDYEYIKKQ